jgi:hypothetical protein
MTFKELGIANPVSFCILSKSDFSAPSNESILELRLNHDFMSIHNHILF